MLKAFVSRSFRVKAAIIEFTATLEHKSYLKEIPRRTLEYILDSLLLSISLCLNLAFVASGKRSAMLSKHFFSHSLKGRLCVCACTLETNFMDPEEFSKAIIDERHIKTYQRVSLRNDEVRNRRLSLIYSAIAAFSTHNRLICFKLLFRSVTKDFSKSYVHVSERNPRGLKWIV